MQDNHAASFNPELCGLLAVSEVTPVGIQTCFVCREWQLYMSSLQFASS